MSEVVVPIKKGSLSEEKSQINNPQLPKKCSLPLFEGVTNSFHTTQNLGAENQGLSKCQIL